MEHLPFLTNARELFTEMLQGAEDAIDLGKAALLIASEEYPGLDLLRYVAKLEAMAATVRPQIAAANDAPGRIEALNAYLFETQRFRGNAREYYDPRNSFLNEVLDRKVGIPITISVVYVEVGRRTGMRLRGVGMPGHFIVKYEDPDEQMFIDPFNGGHILSRAACEELIQQIYGEPVPFQETFLAAVTPKQLLARMLHNLKAIYLHEKQYLKALSAVERLLLIQPGAEPELKDRAALRNLIGMLN
jgi:regulator of sirC expression with transglutaminase-like and TPR domain